MVMRVVCRAAPSMNSSMDLYNSICEGSFSISCCTGSLRKVRCTIGRKYYCFNYQESILTCINYYLFTTPRMCCKGLRYVSHVLMSTTLFSFTYGAPYWLLLHNSYQLDSIPNQLYFQCWLLWEQTPISRLLQISSTTLLLSLSTIS